MKINNQTSYFKIIGNTLVETTNRKERSSLKQLLNFFNDKNILKSDETLEQFKNQWSVIKDNFENKKLESRYGIIGVIIRIFYNLFSENQNTILSRLDSKIEEEYILSLKNRDNFLIGLKKWLVDPNAKGNKQEAFDRIKKCKDNPDLKSLNLHELALTTLPDCITEIHHLEELDLKGNDLQSLPESIGSLINLKELDLSENKIRTLPVSIGSLINLEKLFLTGNELQALPDTIESLSKLQRFSLIGNPIQALPDCLASLTFLLKLEEWLVDSDAKGNKQEAADTIKKCKDNPDLKSLNLQKLGLNTLPDCITEIHHLEELDLKGNNLQSLPESIGSLIDLEKLFLSGNKLQLLPESIGDLSNLKGLDLSNNELQSLPESIKRLINLEKLFLSGNKLQALSDTIESLPKLRRFSLIGNPIQAPPDHMRNLIFLLKLEQWFVDENAKGNKQEAADRIKKCKNNPDLKSLNLEGLRLTTLPDYITEILHLEELVLYTNLLQALPEKIGNLVNLKRLILSYNQIQVLPESIGNLVCLETLSVHNNQLQVLPKTIENLVNLEILALNRNQLKELPDSIGNFVKLKRLALDDNNIETLPETIGNLVNLESFKMKESCLRVLPESIGRLINLKRLDLLKNKLENLPESIGNLVNLEHLDLRENHLQVLPESIGSLTSLKQLYLISNKLKVVPETIGNLLNLQDLYLTSNKLQVLPGTIGKLINLEYLDLEDNRLQVVPETIGNLVDLTYLGLDDNQIQLLPETIGNLVNIQTLTLSQNQIAVLPETIGNLVNIDTLTLYQNQIAALPETIGNLRNLRLLDLDSNLDLVDLPLSLGNIPSLISMSIEKTNIPTHIVEAILNSCKMLRGNESINSLPILLTKWLKIAYNQSEIANQLFVNLNIRLNDEEKSHLYEWLIRLEQTKDFKNNQSQLAAITGEILKALLDYPEFRKVFFTQVELNNTACEDRSAMAYNEIYLSYCLCVKANELGDKEKLLLMLKGARTQALIKDLSALIDNHQSKTHSIIHESVEIYLYYLTHLRESLDLLLAIQNMRHKVIGRRVWINEESLIVRVKQNTLDELVSLPAFEDLLKKDKVFNQELEKLTEENLDKLENLYKDNSWYRNTNAVQKEFELQKQDLLKKWALKLINDYQSDF